MANLTESLQTIQKSNKSLAEKKAMCIKLGLRPRDIEYLEFQGFFNGAEVLTFGVEIECNVNRSSLMMAARRTGFRYQYEGYNHHDQEGYFKFVPDGSVGGDGAIECVSPVLKSDTDGFDTLKTCLDTLNRAGASVNKTCGLHVHVGVSKFTGEQIVNIYKNYQKLERLIDSFMAPSRRGNGCRWAYSLLGYDFNTCHNANDVRFKLMSNRYHKVNPMAYYCHGTVEFRQHQGTVDYTKISMWVNFVCKLVEWSKENVLDHYVYGIEDVPFINAEEKAFFAERIAYFNA